MPTFLTILPFASPDSVGVTAIELLDSERTIFSDSRVKNWWRADHGFDSTGWMCRKTDAKLVKAYTSLPTAKTLTGIVSAIAITNAGTGYATAPTITIDAPPTGGTQATATATVAAGLVTAITITNQGAGYAGAPAVAFSGGGGSAAAATATYSALGLYNGKTVLQAGSGATNGELYDNGLALLPINTDFSVVWMGRPGSPDIGFMWGNGGTVAANTLVGEQIGASSAPYKSTVWAPAATTASTPVASTGTPSVNYDAPLIHVVSFGETDRLAKIMLSPGNTTASATMHANAHNTNGTFHVLGASATQSSTSYPIDGGDLAEIFIISCALHLAANADLLSTIQAYLGARYNKTVP